jgi:hypothetical protein
MDPGKVELYIAIGFSALIVFVAVAIMVLSVSTMLG